MSLAALNTGGNHSAVSVNVSDGTGFAITVAAAATPQAVLSSTLLTEKKNSTGGGITFAPATGVFTVATPAGLGRYLAIASAGNTQGQNSAFHNVQFFAREAGVAAAAKGIKAQKLEGAAAAQGNCGVALAIVDLSAIGDTVELRVGVQTNGNAITFRELEIDLIKIGEV
jgi:hypothetical protein